MMMRPLLACLLVVALAGATSALRRVCYYTNWAQYRNNPAKFYPENTDPNLCTHVIYAFAKLNGNHLAAYEWNDESTPWMKGMYERMRDHLNTASHPIKHLLSVGGWNMASAPFMSMVATATGRHEFCSHAVTFLRQHGFDGLDVDWEYPANRGSPPADKENFIKLLQDCHDEFGKENIPAGKDRLMLASAVAAGKSTIDTGYDIPRVSALLDMINIMTYDLHGSWEDHTGHHSALYSRTGETGDDLFLNVDWAAQYWVQKGAARSKINLGVPLYGRTFTLPYSHTNEMIGCQAKGAGQAGQYTREGGFLAYYEICKYLAAGATKYYQAEQKVPYYVKNDQWVGYEDTDSVKTKVKYIVNNNFGGVMVWALDLDDFSGSCGQGKYPLMHAIQDEINNCVSTGACSGIVTQTPTPTNRTTTFSTVKESTLIITTTPTPTPTTTKAPVSTTSLHTTTKTSQAPVSTTSLHTTTKTVPTTTTTLKMTTQALQNSVKPDRIISPLTAQEFDCARHGDGYYQDPTSCSSFYICAGGHGFKSQCHAGLLYDHTTGLCDFPDHVTCTAHNPTHHQSVKSTSGPTMLWPNALSISQAPATGTADFCKGKAAGYHFDPKDCTFFYECVGFQTFHLHCGSGLFWDQSRKTCDYKQNVVCFSP